MKPTNITLLNKDITTLKVDGIVNSANKSLCGGGGVDGAIHRAAGKELLAKCRSMGNCETGHAVLTSGYKLPAQYIIHTVGPVWYGGHRNEAQLLRSCYQKCMEIATQKHMKSIAFPAISCGAYRYPITEACSIAIDEIKKWLKHHDIAVFLTTFDKTIHRQLHKTLSI